MTKPVLLNVDQGVLEVTLNRPDSLNAFTVEMNEYLREAFARALRDDDIRAVLLTGAGRGFCAGQDLLEHDLTSDETVDIEMVLLDHYNPLIQSIRELPKPVICAVNGVAAGAGANLAFVCDIIVAAKSASFIQAFAKIGLMPDAGGTWSLTHLVGEMRAKALAMTGEPLSAQMAQEWGLVWRIFEDSELMEEARKLAISLGAGPTLALGATKAAIQTASTASMEELLDFEAKHQGRLSRGKDFKEGVAAFLEKRAPVFKGK